MAGFTDFLAGCVVGGSLIATGVVLSKWGRGSEELHVSMPKEGTMAYVWAVDRSTGEARFVSASPIPRDALRQVTREQSRQVGEMMASGNLIETAANDFFGGMAEGALRAKLSQTGSAR